MSFSIQPVQNAKETLRFIKSQWNFYQNDPHWVPPLIMDRKKLLDTKNNPLYTHTDIQCFIAVDNNKIVGRIAAIYNRNHLKTHNDGVGFFGFFECIDNQEIANALIDTAKQWVKAKGCTSLRGPVNPTLNDETGLLVEGFDSSPIMLMCYNPPYYERLLLNSGLDKVKDLYAYYINFDTYMTEKMIRVQAMIRQRNDITIRKMNLKNKTQFKKDVEFLRDIYNQAWQPNWGFVRMTDAEFDYLANDLKQIANGNLILLAEVKGKPAGFVVALPNVNDALKHNKSGGLLTGVWHLLTKLKKTNWGRLPIMGVLPEYQKTGLDAVLYHDIGVEAKKLNIFHWEASWILEDNVMMNRAMTESMNGKRYKTYRLYEMGV